MSAPTDAGRRVAAPTPAPTEPGSAPPLPALPEPPRPPAHGGPTDAPAAASGRKASLGASGAVDDARRARLVTMRRRATALLGAVSAVFVATTVSGSDATWVAYVQATAAASMVGGLADWFAVVALFRHPLGLPIPHTAIVVARKDQFAETLGGFIQDSFLTPEALAERIHAARPVERLAAWLATPEHADRVAKEVVDAVVAGSDLLKDHDVHRALEGLLRQRAERIDIAAVAGRVLAVLLREGRHEEVVDAGLVGLDRYLREHEADLRQRFAGRSRGWLRAVVDQRVFERVLAAVRAAVAEARSNPEHDLRRDLTVRLERLAEDLQRSPELRARGEQLRRDLLERPEVRRWVADLWTDAKGELRASASDAGSDLRRQVAAAVVNTGRRLQTDRQLVTTVERALEAAAAYAAGRSRGAVSGLVGATIARWDAEETASRLEVLLGPDLQWVRINGTVVGGGAGLVLHALADLLR